jgi:SAM-dependent methyltransferase
VASWTAVPEHARITDQNRRAWDEIAEVRASRWREKHPDELFRRGHTVLADEVRAAAGDVTGRRLLHLQCASGEETLSWAALGAQATGVDISDRCIMLARERATTLGLDVRFVAADVYALPADLTGFDVVYTGGGALVWLPELEEWARAVHRALARSGTLLLAEEHPLATCLMIERGAIRVADDYFQRGRVVPGPPGWNHFDDRGTATEPKYEFVWPLGDIVTALVRSGLEIKRLEEFPTSEHQRWRYGDALEAAAGLPGWFVLLARKP